MPATLRYRGDKKKLMEMAKNLDAFKKVPEEYTETTEIGGTLSLLSRLLIFYLIYKEFCYYRDANLVFQFEPDVDMDEKVPMHVDITVAMPCISLSGVDLMDETRQDIFSYGTLQREDTWWELSAEQHEMFEQMKRKNSFLREEHHSVADLIFKDIIKNYKVSDSAGAHNLPAKGEQFNACRLHGTLNVNKVAGVLHIVGGTQPVVGLFNDHWFIHMVRESTNYTHRINRLSFGSHSLSLVQPLEFDEMLVTNENTVVQYFLTIVPTKIHTMLFPLSAYQYSVTENVRILDADPAGASSPGIYFKYDWSALKIIVRTDRDNFVKFLIRLCSIISGIIVISGILSAGLVAIQRATIRVVAPQLLQSYKPLTSDKSKPIPDKAQQNDLLTAANSMTPTISPPPAVPHMPDFQSP